MQTSERPATGVAAASGSPWRSKQACGELAPRMIGACVKDGEVRAVPLSTLR